MPHGAVCVAPPCRAPLRAQPSPCAVLTALRPHPASPRLGDGGEASGAVRVDHPGLAATWPRDRPCVDRLKGTHLGPRARATAQDILRGDGREEPRDRQVHPRLLHHWHPQWPSCPPPCGRACRRTSVARARWLLRRSPRGVMVSSRVCASAWALPRSTPSAACCLIARPQSRTTSALRIPSRVRHRDGFWLVAFWALPGRAGGLVGRPCMCGQWCLCTLRRPVRPFPVCSALPSQSPLSGSDALVALEPPCAGRGVLSLPRSPQEP